MRILLLKKTIYFFLLYASDKFTKNSFNYNPHSFKRFKVYFLRNISNEKP